MSPMLYVSGLNIKSSPVLTRRDLSALDSSHLVPRPRAALPHNRPWRTCSTSGARSSRKASVNIQYLENLQDEVERITGQRAAYIIPREFLNNSADEISVVDAPSEESVLGGIQDDSVRLAEKHKLSR